MHLLPMQTVTLALILGVTSYIVARRLQIPAILFYLVSGMIAGPVGLNLIQPAKLGDGLLTLVEMGVAIILFEGGLALSRHSFKKESLGIRRILIVVLPVTGIGAALLANRLLGISWQVSLFFGALIVVTGPTVIGSILKSVSLTPRLETLLNWESLWGDVIGVLVSALALEFILLHNAEGLPHLMLQFGLRILVGIGFGAAAGFLLSKILYRILTLKDPSLSGIVVVAGALGTFFFSNMLLESSGPLAAAIAGFSLTNLKLSGLLHEIRHFKEQLASLFISTLFVLLSAAIDPRPYLSQWAMMLAVAFILGGIIRPVAVLIALHGTPIPMRERIFVGWIGPRGIIAVATAAYAALVVGEGREMDLVLNLTFAIIFFSGTVATLLCRPLAQALGVRVPLSGSGILFVGINTFTSALADAAGRYVSVAFLETNQRHCELAQSMGHETVCANLLDAEVYEEATRDGFERLIAMTRNDALNELIVEKAAAHLTVPKVYRARARGDYECILLDASLHTQVAFSDKFSLTQAEEALENKTATIKSLPPEDLHQPGVIPLLEISESQTGIRVVRAGESPERTTICIVFTECKSDPDPALTNHEKSA